MLRVPFVLALVPLAPTQGADPVGPSEGDSLGRGVEVLLPGPGETASFEARRARGSRGE